MNFKVSQQLLKEVASSSHCFHTMIRVRNSNKYVTTLRKSGVLPEISALYCAKFSSTIDEIDSFELESSYAGADFKSMARGDEEKLRKLKVLQLEVDMLFQQGEKVPTVMKEHHWKELLRIPGDENRANFLRFLWMNEMRRDNKKRKQEMKRVEFETKKREGKLVKVDLFANGVMNYGLSQNTLFHRIYESQIDNYYNYRAFQAMMFGEKILIDCGYEPYMTRKELSNCAKQLCLMWALNRSHEEPSDIIFCNADAYGALFSYMAKFIPTMYEKTVPLNWTPKNYMDLFPREKLVYLTPHCNNELDTYDPNSIYIIGAIVDKHNCEPLSMAKAKRDRIRMAKFPLDRYLHWGLGIKTLTLNQVLSIMNDMKVHNDWDVALQHVPRRKLMRDPVDEYMMDKQRNHVSAKAIRDQYRRNLVYDLLLKDRMDKL